MNLYPRLDDWYISVYIMPAGFCVYLLVAVDMSSDPLVGLLFLVPAVATPGNRGLRSNSVTERLQKDLLLRGEYDVWSNDDEPPPNHDTRRVDSFILGS